jgi:hypothetical protein
MGKSCERNRKFYDNEWGRKIFCVYGAGVWCFEIYIQMHRPEVDVIY